jgi:DNA-binding PadR family transcriptional regulator
MYPLLVRLAECGWLKCKTDPKSGPRTRKEYSLAKNGHQVLAFLKIQPEELHRELVLPEDQRSEAVLNQ